MLKFRYWFLACFAFLASMAYAADDYALASATPNEPVFAIGGVVGVVVLLFVLQAAVAALKSNYVTQVRPLVAGIVLHMLTYGINAADGSIFLVSCLAMAALVADWEFGLRFLGAALEGAKQNEEIQPDAKNRLERARILAIGQIVQWGALVLFGLTVLLTPTHITTILCFLHWGGALMGIGAMWRLRILGILAAEKLLLAWLPFVAMPVIVILNSNSGWAAEILHAVAACMSAASAMFYVNILHPKQEALSHKSVNNIFKERIWRKRKPVLSIDDETLLESDSAVLREDPIFEPLSHSQIADSAPITHDITEKVQPLLLIYWRDGKYLLSKGALQLLDLPLSYMGNFCSADEWLSTAIRTDAQTARNTLQGLSSPTTHVVGITLRLPSYNNTNKLRYIRIQGSRLSLDESTILATVHDVSEDYQQQQQFLQEAQTDAASGLFNKTVLTHKLYESWAQAPNGVLYVVKINNLETIYRLGGRRCGDFIIRKVAQKLEAACTTGDICGRLSDDMLAVFFSQHDAVRAKILDQDLRQSIAYGTRNIMPFLKTKVVLAPQERDKTAADWLMIAEQQFQNISIFEQSVDNNNLMPDALTLGGELHAALPEGKIQVSYQPIVRLQNQQIIGVEAQMCWNHARYGTIEGEMFKNTALQSGLMPLLSRFVLATAAEHLSKWQRTLQQQGDARARSFFVTASIMREQLNDGTLAEDIPALLRAVPLQMHTLRLEIADEGEALNNVGINTIKNCIDAGGLFIADDFGRGLHSFADLRTLPLTGIKLHRNLVDSAYNNRQPDVALRGRAILRGILQMAHDIGIDVIAEGITSMATAEKLLSQGCQYGQGQAFGKLLSEEQFTQLLFAKQRAPATVAYADC